MGALPRRRRRPSQRGVGDRESKRACVLISAGDATVHQCISLVAAGLNAVGFAKRYDFVNLNIDVDFPPELNQEQRVAQGMSTTAFHLVNSVSVVCEAANPGIESFLDLPMITGRMGTHTTAR